MSDTRPNILWLGVDELSLHVLSTYGSMQIQTPNIDRLARESMVFDNAFCPTAVCAPARAAMLTGRLPSEGGVMSNVLPSWLVPTRATDRKRILETWIPVLQGAGYRTVHVGKWHLTASPDDRPTDYGLEGTDFSGFGENWHEPAFLAYRRELGLSAEPELDDEIYAKHPVPSEFEPKAARLRGPVEGDLSWYLTTKTIERLRELTQSGKKTQGPFLLRCEFWGPHMPCYVPEPYYSMYPPEDLRLPASFGALGTGKPEIQRNFSGVWGIATHPVDVQRRYISTYLAGMTFIDAQIGRILEALDAGGISDNTVVIFTSDHGDMLGAHALFDKGPFMYDDIYRVPLIVRWPSKVKPSRSGALVYNMDLAPTLCDLAGRPGALHGSAKSLLPVITGNAQDAGRDFIISEFWHHFDFYPQAMVHSGHDKFVFNFGGVDEYYDLKRDPLEMINTIGEPQNADRINRMREHLLAWVRAARSPMREGFERTLPAKRGF